MVYLLLTVPHMNIVRVLRRKIIFAAAWTLDWFTDLVNSAQVEDENLFLLEQLVAEFTHHLETRQLFLIWCLSVI